MAARRQMRTQGERTSGAWTGGCAIHPDGGDETDRAAGNSYTATPHNTQLTQEGIISTTKILEDGKSVRRYDLVPTIQAYVKYLSDKAYGKQHRTDKEIELREQKMQADIALKESQGELHRLKTEIAAGQYISVEEVKLDYAKFFVVFKKFAMSIPARVTGMLSGQMEPSELRRCEKEIAAEVNRLLGAFVIAGILGPEDVKKDGTLKEEKNTDS